MSWFGSFSKKRKEREGEDPSHSSSAPTELLNGGPRVPVALGSVSTDEASAAGNTTNVSSNTSTAGSMEYYYRPSTLGDTTPLSTSRHAQTTAAPAVAFSTLVPARTTTTQNALPASAARPPRPSMVRNSLTLPRDHRYRPILSPWADNNNSSNSRTSSSRRSSSRSRVQLQQVLAQGLTSTRQSPFLPSTLSRNANRWNDQGRIVSTRMRIVDPALLPQQQDPDTADDGWPPDSSRRSVAGSTDASASDERPIHPRVRRRRIVQERLTTEDPVAGSVDHCFWAPEDPPPEPEPYVLGLNYHCCFSTEPLPRPTSNISAAKRAVKPAEKASPEEEEAQSPKRIKESHSSSWTCKKCSTVNSIKVVNCSKCNQVRQEGGWGELQTMEQPKLMCPVCSTPQTDENATKCVACNETIVPDGKPPASDVASVPSKSFGAPPVGGASVPASAPLPASSSNPFSFGVVSASSAASSSTPGGAATGGFQISASQAGKPFTFGAQVPSAGTNGLTGGFQFGTNHSVPPLTTASENLRGVPTTAATGFTFTAQNGGKGGEKPAKTGRPASSTTTGDNENDESNKAVSKPPLSAPFSFGTSSGATFGTSEAPPATDFSAASSTELRNKRQGREEDQEDKKQNSNHSGSFGFGYKRRTDDDETTPETGSKPSVLGAPPYVAPTAAAAVNKTKSALPQVPFSFGGSTATPVSAPPMPAGAAPRPTETSTFAAPAPFSFSSPGPSTSASPTPSSSPFVFGSKPSVSSTSAQPTEAPAHGPVFTFGSSGPPNQSIPPAPSVPAVAPFSFGSSATASAVDESSASTFAFRSTAAPSTDMPATQAPAFSFGSSAQSSQPGSSASSPGGNESKPFGQAQGSTLGSAQVSAPTSFSFGSSTAPASVSHSFQFGSAATTSTPAAPPPFGSAPVAQAATQFGFGGQPQLQQQTSSSSTGTFQFGSSSTAATPAPGGFGGSSSSFGATPAAAAPPSAPSFVFGGQAALPAPAVGSFGQPQQQATGFTGAPLSLGGFGGAPASGAGSGGGGFSMGQAPRGRRIVKAKRPGTSGARR